jgi:hypothetical protein
MAQDTIAFLEKEADTLVHLLDCTDGAVIALTVAVQRADLVRNPRHIRTSVTPVWFPGLRGRWWGTCPAS